MSRIGKIARLPKAVRDELNRRLEDGEEGKALVAWLNGHAEVQSVLKAQYDGRAINEPNLTAWRQGGFLDWLRQQEALGVAERLVEETSELGALSQGRLLVDRVAMMAALALGEQLMAAWRMEEGAEKRRAILKLVRGLVRLRKSDREQEQAMREEQAEERRMDYHQDWIERMRKPKEPFAELSDTELMRRIEELRAIDAGPIGDPAAAEWEDEDYDEEEGEDARSTSSGQTQRLETGDRRQETGLPRAGARGGRHASFEVRGGEAHGIHRPAVAGPMADRHGKEEDAKKAG